MAYPITETAWSIKSAHTTQHSAAQHGAARRGMANTHAPNNAQIREIGWGGTVLLWSSSQMCTKE